MTAWARLTAALRGPHVPIAVIIAILILNYTTYRRTIAWQWPVERWTMYETRARLDPVADYRRILAHDADGTMSAIDLGRAFGFLAKPYRLDRGIRRSKAAFLRACLYALRAKEGRHIVGLSYERRSWRYQDMSLAEHEATELPDRSYAVIAVDQPSAELVATTPVASNLLRNSGFSKLGRSGAPRQWSVGGGAWLGVGIEFGTRAQAAMLARSPSPHHLAQVVPLPALRGPIAIELDVLVRPEGPGGYVELVVTSPAGEIARVRTEATELDSWQRVAIDHTLAAPAPDTELTVVLGNPGAANVYFDHATLSAMSSATP